MPTECFVGLAAAGDCEAFHDPAREERQGVRRPASQHDAADGETGSGRLRQHRQQGERSHLRRRRSPRGALSSHDGRTCARVSRQSWSQVVRQTEALGRVMRGHADDLNSGPLHRLATLIRDKQQVKKSYQSLHQQLESHKHKVCC